MITTEQLATALERLSVSDRELLDLSLRRRVPDEALASVLGCQAAEVARRRAGAIDRLSEDLQIRRGEDLGTMLTRLLEVETWEAVRGHHAGTSDGAVAAGPDAAAPAGEPGAAGADDGGPSAEALAEEAPAAAEAPAPDEEAPAPAEEAPAPVEEAPAPAEEAPPPAEQAPSPPPEPVLEMLGGEEPVEGREGRPTRRWLAAGLGGAAALLGAGFAGGALIDNGSDASEDRSGTRHFTPEKAGPFAAPFPSTPDIVAGYLTASVRRRVVLYERPGGRPLIKVPARTEWGSPRVFSVVRRRVDWLGVLAPELKNGAVGWLPLRQAQLGSLSWSLHVDLSKRLLTVRKGGRTVRKTQVAIGSRRHPTPSGRFAVTDKLRVVDRGSPYGCCVLALTGHQTRLPADWPGGDRLAIHATTDVASIGKGVSLGCMRSTTGQARWLIETVPLGTPVFIRS